MHATLLKFGYPENTIHEFEHWVLLVRPAQATLGACVLVSKSEHTAFGQLPVAAFTELGQIVNKTESALKKNFNYDKINYLMLMMVDPHVHFHIIPRYKTAITFAGNIFQDLNRPLIPPEVNMQNDCDKRTLEQIKDIIKTAF